MSTSQPAKDIGGKMCEESACLVPPLEQLQNGHPEPRLSATGSGGGVGIGGEALVGFHEDAISQAAAGKAQLFLSLILGLALAAEHAELKIVGFILPSAELQLCIDEHKKGWLVSITLLALAVGSFVWGILGDRVGRRRALMSAMSVAALFSAVASVMPTYGTFMTARFCSGLGISGAIPLTYTYLAETCPRSTRARYNAFLSCFWPMGAVMTALFAHMVLPMEGAELVLDTREHWSSWHKFLLLNILPTIICIVGLIWSSESPRYLLEASREVEALAVYQRLHRMNKARTQYGLTELELPARSAYRDRPVSPSRNVIAHGFNTLRESFQRLSSPSHFRTTLLLASINLIIGFVYMGVTTFAGSFAKETNDLEYLSLRKYCNRANYNNYTFNSTIENVQYKDSIFRNTTFTHLDFNHVEFVNCLFEETEFSNIKSSITYFENSTIRNSKFIDTDLTDHAFINCNLINNTFLSIISECVIDFDYNTYLDELFRETVGCYSFMMPGLIILGVVLEATPRPPILVIVLVLASLIGISLFFVKDFISVVAAETFIKTPLVCALSIITLVIIEAFPCHLRCTAHGIMRCLFLLGSLCGIPIYNMLVHTMLLFPAVITFALVVFTAMLASNLQDNNKVLL